MHVVLEKRENFKLKKINGKKPKMRSSNSRSASYVIGISISRLCFLRLLMGLNVIYDEILKFIRKFPHKLKKSNISVSSNMAFGHMCLLVGRFYKIYQK